MCIECENDGCALNVKMMDAMDARKNWISVGKWK